jgi:hypothetical protein
VALNKAQRSERARNAVNARWAKHGEEGKIRQRLTMVEAQARQLGYRLEPIDCNEEKEGQ